MFLTSIILGALLVGPLSLVATETNATVQEAYVCPEFENVENGIVQITSNGFEQIAVVSCEQGYDLDGSPNVYCIRGVWEKFPRPQCNKRCPPPPYIKNGSLEIDRSKDENGLFHKGTLATYSCGEGFYLSPKESEYRVCEKGIWTGPYATCVSSIKITGCSAPKSIENGYFVPEKSGMSYERFSVGQRLHYSCKSGYVLIGTTVQQCLEDGTWSPKIPPVCSQQIPDDSSINDFACPASPSVPHTFNKVIQGFQSDSLAIPGTVVQIHCISKYRNSRAPCQPGKLRCIGGRWVGVTPICVPARDCDPPPAVSYAVIYSRPLAYEQSLTNKYPIKSQISYQCLPGYTLQGNEIFACSTGGCWLPVDPPTCYRASSNYYLEVNNINAILISAATGAGVLGLLLVICLIVMCRRRKPLTRTVTITPPVQRTADLGDHASLLHHPDRLALIAFADGIQNDQSALPSYDEATRERGPGLTSNRLHRPHWPNLAMGRRSRNAPNTDIIHVTRHGSFASHTPSTRSAGDSMGSTDTVAISEGSTNVTLDTASSHSGSQPASCRVHCGSLASFDTSSVVNTEGVPLLEESELEEVQGGDNISLVVENPSLSDSTSFKFSTHSTDLS